jgi:hypothetical protein
MVQRVYSKLPERKAHLRAAAENAVKKGEGNAALGIT